MKLFKKIFSSKKNKEKENEQPQKREINVSTLSQKKENNDKEDKKLQQINDNEDVLQQIKKEKNLSVLMSHKDTDNQHQKQQDNDDELQSSNIYDHVNINSPTIDLNNGGQMKQSKQLEGDTTPPKRDEDGIEFTEKEEKENIMLQSMQQSYGLNPDVTYRTVCDNEFQILNKFTGLKVNESVFIYNVPFKYKNINTYIHTIECGRQNEPIMVLVHGYGGAGVMYYSLLKQLSQKYHVYAIDIIGMGLSDRQKFNVEYKTESIIEFFVETVNQWRNQLGLELFTLIGHSFGGYVSANFAVRYPQYIKQLFLLSPMAGTKNEPFEGLAEEEDLQVKAKKHTFVRKLILRYIQKKRQNKITFQDISKKWFFPTKFFIKKAVHRVFGSNNKDEYTAWINYFINLFKLPESTDHFIHDLITMPNIEAKISIQEQFEQNKDKLTYPIHIYYGELDWMDSTGLRRISKNLKGTFKYIKGASHQICLDQPQTMVGLFLNPFENIES